MCIENDNILIIVECLNICHDKYLLNNSKITKIV